jgi:hypothetical protein
MKINLSPTKANYYSQLNNELNPYIACQVTSMVMGLDAGGFGLGPIMPLNPFKQPADQLRYYLLKDPAVQDYWRKNYDTKIPAPEWAGVMVWAVNRLYGREVCYFDGRLTLGKIIDDLDKGLPTYISMRFPDNRDFSGKPEPVSGHIVLAVGIDGERLIVNDPYKNHLTGDREGWNNVYSPGDFQKHARGHGIRYQRI